MFNLAGQLGVYNSSGQVAAIHRDEVRIE